MNGRAYVIQAAFVSSETLTMEQCVMLSSEMAEAFKSAARAKRMKVRFKGAITIFESDGVVESV
jgi:hypothetical protein